MRTKNASSVTSKAIDTEIRRVMGRHTVYNRAKFQLNRLKTDIFFSYRKHSLALGPKFENARTRRGLVVKNLTPPPREGIFKQFFSRVARFFSFTENGQT